MMPLRDLKPHRPLCNRCGAPKALLYNYNTNYYYNNNDDNNQLMTPPSSTMFYTPQFLPTADLRNFETLEYYSPSPLPTPSIFFLYFEGFF